MITYLRVGKHSYVADSPAELEKLRKHKFGELVEAKIRRRRNLKHHRKFRAILRMVAHNFPGNVQITDEDVLVMLKITMGMEEDKPDLFGKVKRVLRSTSFEEMDQHEFAEFYNRAIPMLSQASGLSVEHIDANYEDYV